MSGIARLMCRRMPAVVVGQACGDDHCLLCLSGPWHLQIAVLGLFLVALEGNEEGHLKLLSLNLV